MKLRSLVCLACTWLVPSPAWTEAVGCQQLLDAGGAALEEVVGRTDSRLLQLAWEESLAGPDDRRYLRDVSAAAISDLAQIQGTLPVLGSSWRIEGEGPVEVYGLAGDLYLLAGRRAQAVESYRKASKGSLGAKTRCGFLYEGKLYVGEVGRKPNEEKRRMTGFLLALDPGSGRVLERYFLPGEPLELSLDGGMLRISYSVRSVDSSPVSRAVRLVRGRLDPPVWASASAYLLDRHSSTMSRWGLLENFYRESRAFPSFDSTERASLSERAPSTLEELEESLRNAALDDPTEPWRAFFLGQCLWAQGRHQQADESWEALFAKGFPAIPYYEIARMAYLFEVYGQPQWADRAFRAALERRRGSPQQIGSSSVLERLINVPFSTRKIGDRRNPDPDRAHLWWVRTREISGISEGDDLRAALWVEHFRRLGEKDLAAQEIQVLEAVRGYPEVQITRIAWADYSLWLCIATLGGLLLVVAWLLLGALRAAGPALRQIRRLLQGGTLTSGLVRALFSRVGFLLTALAIAYSGLSLFSLSLAYQGQRFARPLAGSDSSLLDDWSDPDKVGKMSDDERFLAAVASHLAGDLKTARRLYHSLPQSPRVKANLEALDQRRLPLETTYGSWQESWDKALSRWSSEAWHPWREPLAGLYWIVGIEWVNGDGTLDLPLLLSELLFSELPKIPWLPLFLLGTLLAFRNIRERAARLLFALVPGLSRIGRGSPYRGYAVFCLFLFALGPCLWLLAAWRTGAPSPGVYSKAMIYVLDFDYLLPPPSGPVPADPAEAGRRLLAENFWPLLRAYPGAPLFYFFVTAAGLTALAAHARELRWLRRPSRSTVPQAPQTTEALTSADQPSTKEPIHAQEEG